MKSKWLCFVVMLWLLPLGSSNTYAMDARNTADVIKLGGVSVGVFSPLKFSLIENLEFEVHPLAFFIAPHLQVRISHLRSQARDWRITSEWGIMVPHPMLNLPPPFGVKGYLLPTCKVAEYDSSLEDWCARPAQTMVPRVGVVASYGRKNVLTMNLDAAYGWVLSGKRQAPLDTYPPLEILVAPVFIGLKAHGGIRYDYAVTDWLRMSIEQHLYWVDGSAQLLRSRWSFATHWGLDFLIGDKNRLVVGVYYWNSDQRAVDIINQADGYGKVESVRSNDFFPTVDFIWVS